MKEGKGGNGSGSGGTSPGISPKSVASSHKKDNGGIYKGRRWAVPHATATTVCAADPTPPFVLRSPVFKKESELFFSYCIPFTPARSSPEDPFFCGLNKGYITLFPLSKPHAGDGEQVEGMMVCIPVLYIFSSIIYIFRLFSVSQLRTKNNTQP